MTTSRDPGLRVAIVGLGPAGAYAAAHLLADGGPGVRVDAFERLPTPWGLVRAGVAPDRPAATSVTRVFERTAAHPGFTYFGNVEVGRHVSREELLARYHAVIYAVGAQGDRPLAIPGEDLPGSAAAADFVAWYTGRPDHREDRYDLDCRRAIVVGTGNVALDVARMLVLGPADLARTDMADHAVAAFARSRIEEVVVIGRRGPEQAAFTAAELRELGALDTADVAVDPVEVAVPEAFREARPDERSRHNLALLHQYAGRAPAGRPRRIALRFLLSPTRILGEDRVQAVELVRNRLEPEADGRLRAHPTGARATIPAGLVIRAVGSRGLPLPGVPWDAGRETIAHVGGRVVEPGGVPTREYVAGWAKRGPSGAIDTNRTCAADTVRALLRDAAEGRLAAPLRPEPAIEELLRVRRPDRVDYAGWQAIDRFEQERGRPAGRPRAKLTRVSAMVDVAHAVSGVAA